MNPWYKNRITLAIAALVVLVVGGLVVSNMNNDESGTDNERVSETREGEISVKGTIECLPNSGTGENCVKAVRGEDGKVYALNTLTDLKIGTKVSAVGTFEPRAASEESGTFQYDGVLVVRSLQVR